MLNKKRKGCLGAVSLLIYCLVITGCTLGGTQEDVSELKGGDGNNSQLHSQSDISKDEIKSCADDDDHAEHGHSDGSLVRKPANEPAVEASVPIEVSKPSIYSGTIGSETSFRILVTDFGHPVNAAEQIELRVKCPKDQREQAINLSELEGLGRDRFCEYEGYSVKKTGEITLDYRLAENCYDRQTASCQAKVCKAVSCKKGEEGDCPKFECTDKQEESCAVEVEKSCTGWVKQCDAYLEGCQKENKGCKDSTWPAACDQVDKCGIAESVEFKLCEKS